MSERLTGREHSYKCSGAMSGPSFQTTVPHSALAVGKNAGSTQRSDLIKGLFVHCQLPICQKFIFMKSCPNGDHMIAYLPTKVNGVFFEGNTESAATFEKVRSAELRTLNIVALSKKAAVKNRCFFQKRMKRKKLCFFRKRRRRKTFAFFEKGGA